MRSTKLRPPDLRISIQSHQRKSVQTSLGQILSKSSMGQCNDIELSGCLRSELHVSHIKSNKHIFITTNFFYCCFMRVAFHSAAAARCEVAILVLTAPSFIGLWVSGCRTQLFLSSFTRVSLCKFEVPAPSNC